MCESECVCGGCECGGVDGACVCVLGGVGLECMCGCECVCEGGGGYVCEGVFAVLCVSLPVCAGVDALIPLL